MIDLSAIYRNPLIPEDGYFFVKAVEVDMDQVPSSAHPRIFVRVMIHPDHGLGDHVAMASIIYGTDKSKYHRINFLNTFLLPNETNLQLTVGRWGSVYIYRTEYGEAKYSAIKWVYQTRPIRLACARMNQEQQHGRLPQLPRNDPPPQPRVETTSTGNGWGCLQEMGLALINAKLEAKWKKRLPNLPYPRIPDACGDAY